MALGARRVPAACGEAAAERPPAEALWLLDGMFLLPAEQPGRPLLLCGRFEITRGDFAGGELAPAEADLPAVFLSRAEAAQWAAARGLRLPTLVEWRHCAAFGSGLERPRFPWGNSFQPGFANTLELNLQRPLPVGVFEHDWAQLSRYDFFGNVWEWVADAPPAEPGRIPAAAAACGGGYASFGKEAGFLAVRALEPEERAEDLGFRVVAAAAPWLQEYVAPELDTEGASAWLRRAAARWRPELRAQLAAELRRSAAPAALTESLE